MERRVLDDETQDAKQFARLLISRGWLCECCHMRRAEQRHHCLFHDDKRFPFLSGDWNIQLVCSKCHNEGLTDSRENRERFREIQIQRGYEIDAIIENLPLKVKTT